MSESNLWSYLRVGMGPLWEAQRHEDKLTSGIPDVSYSITHHGWIELKYLPDKPKRDNSILKIDHYTPEQRNWLTLHGARGGLCFLMLQVDKTYMIFDWTKAQRIATLPYADHVAMAMGVWEKSINWRHLRSILVSPVKRSRVTVFLDNHSLEK